MFIPSRTDLFNLLRRFSRDELATICFSLGLTVDFAEGRSEEASARELIALYERRANSTDQAYHYLAEDLLGTGCVRRNSDGKLVRSDALEEVYIEAIKANNTYYSPEMLQRLLLARLSLDDIRTWCFYMSEDTPELKFEQFVGGLNSRVRDIIERAGELHRRVLLIEKLHILRPDVLGKDIDGWRDWAQQIDKK